VENLASESQVIESSKPVKRQWLVFFIYLLAVVFLATGALGYAVYQIYTPFNKQGQEQIFEVEKGRGVKEIAQALKQQNFIRSDFWFEIYIWCKNKNASLQAGTYLLDSKMSVSQIADIITGGKALLNEAQITFPEGFTLKQIKARLGEKGVGAANLMGDEKISDFQVQYKFLSDVPSGATLEGFLFPDTYRFKIDDKETVIIKRFLDNFDKKFTPDLREEISRQEKNIYEIVILASIIQQEAVSEAEMPLIAGVFARRLKLGMALESDATVNFVTGKKDRQPLYEDLKIQSPYNTYLHRGLPPGPICNPGLAAIRAAIYPQPTDYLYFLHPLDSATIFSKTLDEHNRNKAKYLK
jgi:UPF0755 protein